MKLTSLFCGLALALPSVLAAALPEPGIASGMIQATSNGVHARETSKLNIDLQELADIVDDAQGESDQSTFVTTIVNKLYATWPAYNWAMYRAPDFEGLRVAVDAEVYEERIVLYHNGVHGENFYNIAGFESGTVTAEVKDPSGAIDTIDLLVRGQNIASDSTRNGKRTIVFE